MSAAILMATRKTAVQRYFSEAAKRRAETLLEQGRCRKCGAAAKVTPEGKTLRHCATCIARQSGRNAAKRALSALLEVTHHHDMMESRKRSAPSAATDGAPITRR